jgi:hypothetical protein
VRHRGEVAPRPAGLSAGAGTSPTQSSCLEPRIAPRTARAAKAGSIFHGQHVSRNNCMSIVGVLRSFGEAFNWRQTAWSHAATIILPPRCIPAGGTGLEGSRRCGKGSCAPHYWRSSRCSRPKRSHSRGPISKCPAHSLILLIAPRARGRCLAKRQR